MVGGAVRLAGGGVRDSVTSDITVVVVGGIPRVGVGVAACLVASKCSGLVVVRFRIYIGGKCCSWGTVCAVGRSLRISVIFCSGE